MTRSTIRCSTTRPALLALGCFVAILPGCQKTSSEPDLLPGPVAIAAPATPHAPVSDSDVTKAILRHFQDEASLRAEHLGATVAQGIATISGSVANLLAARRALDVAETIRGVRAVIDEVEVRSVSRTDAQLEGDVTNALRADAATRAHTLRVTARDGVVTLSGTADSWQERTMFAEVVEEVPGVRSVDKSVVAQYGASRPSAEIATDVRHRLANDVWLDGDALTVAVTGRRVRVSGFVGSVAERRRVNYDEWVAGVDDVDDDGILVDWAAQNDQRRVDDSPLLTTSDSYFGKIEALWAARGSASLAEAGVAVITMALLVGTPKITKRVPAPLVAIAVVAALSTLLASRVAWFHVATIGSRFSVQVDGVTYAGIPPLPPMPRLPWGPGGLSFGAVRDLGGAALAIAMLGAIESLLSAVIADATTGKRHDPDAELVGLGLGNIVAPFFGGIAATGALARTATNIRAGAVSPIAAACHALFVLAAVLLGSRLVAYVPMASLAALLLLVAWNMSEVGHFVHTVRVAPRSDVLVLVTCFVLTVVFDMVVAVSVGVVLAALLFMRRMSAMTEAHLTTVDENDEARTLPPDIVIYEIAGPLFFGAAQRAMRTFDLINDQVKVVVLALGAVPVIDATGLAALEGTLASLEKSNRQVVIAGPLPEPRAVFARAHLDVSHGQVFFADDVTAAVALARGLLGGGGDRRHLGASR